MPVPTELPRPAASDGETIVRALRAAWSAKLIETHISWVLIAGEAAWKIKKPVQLGFLDFSTLDARRHFCEEELRLNRRLAPTLYEAVLPIGGTPQAPAVGGGGPAIEYVLRMRRFPDGALFSERLASGRLEPRMVDRLADRLAAFHVAAPAADRSSPYGQPQRVEADFAAVIERLAARGVDVAGLRDWWAASAPALRPLWQRRHDTGWVREGHGDLHLANVLATDDGDACAFDGIEFDPALRWIDVMADIGFLVMDLLAHGRGDLAFRFLDRHLAITGDHDGLGALRPYIVYRALVRALVQALGPRLPSGPGAAAPPDYLGLALRWRAPAGARLLITHGVSGSGKSHLAAQLLERAGAVRLRSDVERKRLFGLAPLERTASAPGGGLYSAAASARTQARLAAAARSALAAGWPVIVDATFLRHAERMAFADLARELGVPFTILACHAEAAVLHSRIAARAQRADDPSEADEAVLAMQQQWLEPLRPDEAARMLDIDTGGAVDVPALARRWLARA